MGEMTARLARAKAAVEQYAVGERSAGVERRVAHLLREVLATHSEVMLALLAEQPMEPAEQIARMNALVRALGAVQFEEKLRANGRNIPLLLDTSCSPPKIRLHRQLIQGIEDAEVLRAFHAPISAILGISPVGVGLALDCQDARQLKTLVAQMARRQGPQRVRLTQVEALVEQRVQLFNDRIESVVERFGEDLFWIRAGEQEFKVQLAQTHRGWPDWDGVQGSRFIRGVIDELQECITGRSDMPGAQILVELCWESLELSPQSFLRHAAQTLRADGEDYDLVEALRKLADAIGIDGSEAFYSVDAWPVYRDLCEAWDALFRAEQAMLPSVAPRRNTPVISVLERPLESLGICEPSTLPWDAPLLAWSVREHHGLRDLLVGLRNVLEDQFARIEDVRVELDGDSPEPALEINPPAGALGLRVIQRGYALPDDYKALLTRAMHASFAAMAACFERLDPPVQLRVLRTLRTAYDGYFSEARALWARRFQAWEQWSAARAFRVLSTEIRHIAGAAVLFDPFESPASAALAPMPKFVLVAPRPAHFDDVLVQMPIAVLKKSALGGSIRVRLVDVRDAQPCSWVGDLPVSLVDVEEYPTGVLLEAIDRDSVRLLIQGDNRVF